jgi:hypothetical protein
VPKQEAIEIGSIPLPQRDVLPDVFAEATPGSWSALKAVGLQAPGFYYHGLSHRHRLKTKA